MDYLALHIENNGTFMLLKTEHMMCFLSVIYIFFVEKIQVIWSYTLEIKYYNKYKLILNEIYFQEY